MATKQQILYLLEKHGAFGVREGDIPKPGAGELLVEVRAASLNPVDAAIPLMGLWVENYPAVLGCDAAGIVKAVGEGVTGFAVGDKV